MVRKCDTILWRQIALDGIIYNYIYWHHLIYHYTYTGLINDEFYYQRPHVEHSRHGHKNGSPRKQRASVCLDTTSTCSSLETDGTPYIKAMGCSASVDGRPNRKAWDAWRATRPARGRKAWPTMERVNNKLTPRSWTNITLSLGSGGGSVRTQTYLLFYSLHIKVDVFK